MGEHDFFEQIKGIADVKSTGPGTGELSTDDAKVALLLQAAASPIEIKFMAHAQVGRPYFDVLPELLELAHEKATIRVILIVPDDVQDETTNEALRHIAELAQEREASGKSLADIRAIRESDMPQARGSQG